MKILLSAIFLLFLPTYFSGNIMAQNAGNEYVCYEDNGNPYASDTPCSTHTCYDQNGLPYTSSLSCEYADKPVVCACDYCRQTKTCDAACTNPNCPLNQCTCNLCFAQYNCTMAHTCQTPINETPPINSGGSGSGSGSGSGVSTKPNINLTNVSKYGGYDKKKGIDCMKNCKLILANYGLSNCGNSSQVYKLECESGGNLITYGSNPKQNFSNAINCIDRHLSEGRPIIVGVDHSPGSKAGNNDKTTDHFVVITGRGYDSSAGQYYYTYMETGRSAGSAAAACDNNNNRFYYNSNGPSLTDDSAWGHSDGYVVTQVRPNDGINLSQTTSSSNTCE